MRRRILLAILAITALAVALFGIPLGIVVRHQETDEATLRLERQATIAAADVPSDLGRDGDEVALPPPPAKVKYALYTPQGALVTGDGPSHADQTVADATRGDITDTEAGGRLVVAVPVSSNGEVVGVVRAEQPLASVETQVWKRWGAMAAIAFVAFAIAAAVAMIEARRLTRPVEDVRDAARRLGEGDFSVSVAASGVRDLDDVADALTATAHRLGELITRERAFSANASHQLRTPLTGLRLTIETELTDPRDDPTAVLLEALDELDRLEATVSQLLALARDSASPRSPVDVVLLLQKLERRWRRPLAALGRRLEVVVDDELPHPEVSEVAISQVLDVLIDNAARHGAGVVTVEATGVVSGVSLSVTDEGAGIRDPVRIFERRGTDARGHGIGLALARSVVEAEGGRLMLERSAPRPRFVIVLPAARPVREEQQPAPVSG